MLSIAKGLLEEEEREREVEKRRYLAETCPPVCMPRSSQELQVVPRHWHQHKLRSPESTDSAFVFRSCVRRFTARLTRSMRKDMTYR